MPWDLRKCASIRLVPFLTFEKMRLEMPCALRKWSFLIDGFPPVQLYNEILVVDTAGGIRAATVRLTQVCRYGPLPMTLVDKFHQKCGV